MCFPLLVFSPVHVADLLKQNQLKKFEAEGSAQPSEAFKNHSVFSFGANICEVWVDKDTAMALN